MSITLLIKVKCTKKFVTTKLNLEGKGHWELVFIFDETKVRRCYLSVMNINNLKHC